MIFRSHRKGSSIIPMQLYHYPIYLELDVDNYVNKIAQEKNIDVQVLVNEWLRNNIKLIEMIK